MLDRTEVARVLDILGNRNRRRIIELLRQKPCFVTEISERLTLSPKAVIEHLQMMEREEILASRLDERRRKYYYLTNDISIIVSLQKQETTVIIARPDKKVQFRNSLRKMRTMVQAREEMVAQLQHLEQDIDQQIRSIVEAGREVLRDEREIDLVIALSHCDLSLKELEEITSLPGDDLSAMVESLAGREIVEKKGTQFRIRGIHAE